MHFELWVGAPRRDVGAAPDAGVVEHFRLTTSATTDHVSVTHVATVRQRSASVPNTAAEAGDRFGEVLGASAFGVAVGVPHEDIGTMVDAGMVTVIDPTPFGTWAAAAPLTQNSPGMAGAAEAGDRFGAALSAAPGPRCGNPAACSGALLIGVPGEDVGRIKDAGMVHRMGAERRAWTQNSPGIPGAAEAGDRFGAAVATSLEVDNGTWYDLGPPGEDLGNIADAGMVVVGAPCQCNDVCAWWTLTQGGGGVPGTREAGDALGASLSVLQQHRAQTPGESDSDAIMGAPGEDLGTARDAGAAYCFGSDINGFEFSGGPIPGLRYGTIWARDTWGLPKPPAG